MLKLCRGCLVLYVHSLSKNDVLAPPFPKASAKVQPFSNIAREQALFFRENAKKVEHRKKKVLFLGKTEQKHRAKTAKRRTAETAGTAGENGDHEHQDCPGALNTRITPADFPLAPGRKLQTQPMSAQAELRSAQTMPMSAQTKTISQVPRGETGNANAEDGGNCPRIRTIDKQKGRTSLPTLDTIIYI